MNVSKVPPKWTSYTVNLSWISVFCGWLVILAYNKSWAFSGDIWKYKMISILKRQHFFLVCYFFVCFSLCCEEVRVFVLRKCSQHEWCTLELYPRCQRLHLWNGVTYCKMCFSPSAVRTWDVGGAEVNSFTSLANDIKTW